MKKIALLFVLILTYSCGLNYDGETRLVFETRITDHDNNPIAGKYVQIQVFENAVYDGSVDNVISDGFTDANGNIRLIFPSPPANARMTVHYSDDPVFQQKHISNISIYDFRNYKLDLSSIQLYRMDEITTFDVSLNHTGNQTDLGPITIDAVHPDYNFDFSTQAAPTLENYFYDTKVIKNQNVTVHYTVIDYNTTPSTITNYSDIVPVGNNPVDYTITY